MRIRRSVTRFFSVLVIPAVTVAVVSYFGAYAIWGNRGVLALEVDAKHEAELVDAEGPSLGLDNGPTGAV